MSLSRRELLVGFAVSSAGLGPNSSLHGAANEGPAVLARRQAVRRRRRIIYNNDGDDIWVPGADTLEQFLDVRHTPLLNTQVDSIYYSTTQSFNYFTHNTSVAEQFLFDKGKFSGNNLRKFLQAGTDGLRMSSEFARRHDLECVWSLRMNDVHDVANPVMVPNWKRKAPRRLMSNAEESRQFSGRRRLWSLVDYEHPDVEPALLAVIAEVLTNYDLDGIELDFLRAPFYFRSSFEGRPASDEQTEVLSKLLRSIRALVLRTSEVKNRPLLLAARVPVTVKLCRNLGIDVVGWLKEQLIDTLALGGGYVANDAPVAGLINLAHQYQVPVYPCLSQSGLLYRPPRGNGSKQPPAAWFGAAMRLLATGADGIYTFNLFPGPGPPKDRDYARQVLTALGSEETLLQQNTLYALSDAGWWMPSHYWAKDAEDFSAALPIELAPGAYSRTYMGVAEDLRTADFGVTAELRIDFTGLSSSAEVDILYGSRNFGTQRGGKEVAQIRRFVLPVPLQAIAQGSNRVMVRTNEAGVKLAGAELWVQRA